MSTTREYAISGLQGARSEAAVKQELRALAGVVSVDVSTASGTAKITSVEPLDISSVRDALAEAGCELVDD